jgi:hypothetical protein
MVFVRPPGGRHTFIVRGSGAAPSASLRGHEVVEAIHPQAQHLLVDCFTPLRRVRNDEREGLPTSFIIL